MEMQLPKKLLKMVKKLNGEELHALNHFVVSRLNSLHKAQAIHALRAFQLLDRVSFDYQGQRKFGTISRINQKTVSIILDTGERWTVSPHILRKETGDHNPLKDIISRMAK